MANKTRTQTAAKPATRTASDRKPVTLERGVAPVQDFDSEASTKLNNNPEQQNAVIVTAVDGYTHTAWRKDGQTPIVDDASFKNNKHAALPPHGTADFAVSAPPKE